jgi:hypothetical protein
MPVIVYKLFEKKYISKESFLDQLFQDNCGRYYKNMIIVNYNRHDCCLYYKCSLGA